MELKVFGVASVEMPNSHEAKGYTYTMNDGSFPSTILSPPLNPYTFDNAKNILDFGCGVGRNLAWIMQNTDANYIGLEPNSSMRKYFWDIQEEQYPDEYESWKDRVTLASTFSEIPDVKVDWFVSTFVMQHLGYRLNVTPNLTDIYNELMKFAHDDSHWFLIEHDSEENWIEHFQEQTGVEFEVYERSYTWQENLTHRDHCAPNGGNHLIIW